MSAISLPVMLGQVWQYLVGRSRSLASNGQACIRSIGRTSLTPTHSVHLIEVQGERLVIGCHPGGMTILHPQPGDECEARK